MIMNENFENIKIVVVISEFNSVVVSELLDSFNERCKKYLGIDKNMIFHTVPGAFEIPGMVSYILENNMPDAIVTLGSVIRGETNHYDYVAENCARGISELSIKFNLPIIFGVLCTENLEQALVRSESKGGDMLDAAIRTLIEYRKVDKH
tara:strand:- start:111 stop:560 length:450 start_codon:yes stop_codon:yes gene_type:complete